MEIRGVQKMLQADDELVHRRLKTYLGGWAVRLAPPDLPGEAYKVFKACEVIYYDRAAYLLSASGSGVADFVSPLIVIPEAGTFPQSSYVARLRVMANNFSRRFGRIFMSKDYQLTCKAGLDPLRVAPYASLHQCADVKTVPKVSQVTQEFKVLHGLPLAAPLLVCFLDSSLSTSEESNKSFFESTITCESLFNRNDTSLHEALFVQQVWLLHSAKASAAKER